MIPDEHWAALSERDRCGIIIRQHMARATGAALAALTDVLHEIESGAVPVMPGQQDGDA